VSCWNCHAHTQGEPFCPSCGKIQPRPPGATLFSVFGLPPSTEIPLPALEKRFRSLALKLHPDRVTGQDGRERRLSLEQTTALNEAYKTLKDPVRRSYYLLKLQGVSLEEEGKGQGAPAMPMEFLEEVMVLREKLESLRGKPEEIRAMADGVRGRQAAALDKAQRALGQRLAHPDDGEALKEAGTQLSYVRYFTRFLEEVERMEEEA
jgi:molecular chaperone HscB